LFNRQGGDKLYSPNVLRLLCKNFSKHLSLFGDKVYQCFELLAKSHLRSFPKETLLEIPCLVYALDSFSLTHFWTFSVTPKVIRYFTSYGFDINIRDESGKTALHWAYLSGKDKIISLCLELTADDSVKDNSGAIPSQTRRIAKKWQSVKLSGSFK